MREPIFYTTWFQLFVIAINIYAFIVYMYASNKNKKSLINESVFETVRDVFWIRVSCFFVGLVDLVYILSLIILLV